MGYSRASYGEAAGSAGWCLHAPYYMLAGENISARFVVPTVAASVDLVVHLGLDHGGVRRVNEIVAVPGRVENDIIETETIFERHGGELRRMSGIPPRPERFKRVGIDVHGLQAGSVCCARFSGSAWASA